MDSNNTKFFLLSLILLILSGLGVFFIFKINNSSKNTISITTPTSIPTKIPTIPVTSTATSTAEIAITPTATPSTKTKAKTTPTPKIKTTPTPTATSSSKLLIFKNTVDKFSVSYSSSRRPYQDTESTGNRYTFYSPSGNFAVHVSPNGTWAWTNPDRNFSSALIISGQNTFRYDIATQTIVDLQSSTQNYTIQCIHNGNEILKTECEAFIKSFQIL